MAHEILALQPIPPALEVQNLNHWAAREVPQVIIFNCCIMIHQVAM